ncbi:MAG: hypothetical protein NVS3B20_12470 [Polyangiales bacterium]
MNELPQLVVLLPRRAAANGEDPLDRWIDQALTQHPLPDHSCGAEDNDLYESLALETTAKRDHAREANAYAQQTRCEETPGGNFGVRPTFYRTGYGATLQLVARSGSPASFDL